MRIVSIPRGIVAAIGAIGLTLVTLTTASAPAQADTYYVPGHGIKVHVQDESGNPLPKMAMRPEGLNPTTNQWDYLLVGEGLITDANGNVYVPQRTGYSTFRLCVEDANWTMDNHPKYRYGYACWKSGSSLSTATPITITDAVPEPQISVTMKIAGLSLYRELPTVHGLTQVGSQLTVEPNYWGPVPVTLRYQWRHNEMGNFSPIPGATGRTFTPTADLAGKSIAVDVTGSAPGYVTATATGGATVVAPSASVSSFTVTGGTTAGSVMTANITGLSPSTANADVEWFVDGLRLDGPHQRTLTLTSEMAGKSVSAVLRVYAQEVFGVSPRPRAYFAVRPGLITAATPTTTGTPAVGSRLTAAGTWGPGPVGLTYQWLRNGAPISGATQASYVPVAADNLTTLTVRVTGSRMYYTGLTKTSTGAKVVSVLPGQPTITTPSGTSTAPIGTVLTAAPGTWGPSGVTLTYQWVRNNGSGEVAIAGATSATHTVTTADNNSAIKVIVTGHYPGAADKSARSANSIVVGTLKIGEPYPGTPPPSAT